MTPQSAFLSSLLQQRTAIFNSNQQPSHTFHSTIRLLPYLRLAHCACIRNLSLYSLNFPHFHFHFYFYFQVTTLRVTVTMSLTMNRLQHEWRNPRHCAICGVCRANRQRINRESLADAHQTGKLFARDVGAPLDAAPIYERLVRVPRSNQPVLIQLPHMNRPVAPSEPFPLRSRKRRYTPLTPVPLTPQKRLYTTLQQEHNESAAEATELCTPVPVSYDLVISNLSFVSVGS